MDTRTVLVIGSESTGELTEALSQLGVPHLRRSGILDAMDVLKHRELGWVLINTGGTEVDLLELVLNIRDVQADVPILIGGPADTGPARLIPAAVSPRVHALPTTNSGRELAKAFVAFLEKWKDPSAPPLGLEMANE